MFDRILQKDFFIKPGYKSRSSPQYYEYDTQGISYQPDVDKFAAYLGERYGCENIIDMSEMYPYERWSADRLDNPGEINIPENLLKSSIIVCKEVIEHLVNPDYMLLSLKKLMDYAPVCLLSTPERDLTRGTGDPGPPLNPTHVREWNLKEFKQLLSFAGLNIEHIGLTASDDRRREKKTILAVIGKNGNHRTAARNGNIRVTAIMTAFNEDDIIFHSIKRLINQEIYVYVIDNWSDDSTYQITKQYEGNKFFLGIEKYPPEGPGKYYNWAELLRRKEEVALEIEADWFINMDVDEIRDSPWPEINLKEGIFHVDRMGFNAIDHTELTFRPIDNQFIPGTDFSEYFKCCRITPPSWDYFQVKAWKNTGRPFSFHQSAGHQVTFEGRRVYPYKFLLRHYPIRSQSHGEKKIFTHRKPRYNPEEKSRGWHVHYDSYQQGCSFIHRPEELEFFGKEFYTKFLVERLSGKIFI